MTTRAVFDTGKLDKDLQTLVRMTSRSDQFGALSRALSRAGQSMRKQATKEAQAVLNLKSGPIRDVVKTQRVRRSNLAADLRVIARAQPVIGFKGTRQTRKGLSVQIKKGGARRVIGGAFKATLRSGKASGFQRRRLPGGKRAGRLPIDIVYSSSVRQVLNDPPRQARILGEGRDRFRSEFRREILRRLGAV